MQGKFGSCRVGSKSLGRLAVPWVAGCRVGWRLAGRLAGAGPLVAG